ncbi:MAG: S1C family serine protease, partial [Aureliella sp.]
MGRIVVNVLWLTACLASPLVARAQDTESGPAASSADQAGQLLAQEQAAFASAAAAVSPSVVQIETFGGLERVGKELISDGPTTGTIVGKEGWIISSMYSFRQQPASILVSLSDGSRLPAKIVARDTSRELVLLKIDAKTELPEPTACPIDQLSVGQWAIGLGRTFDREAVSQSVGILSALGRAYGKAVQTDAKVSPVNYGGPLVDLQGRVIGI